MCELVRYKIRSVQNLVKTFCLLGNSELVPVWARYKRLLTLLPCVFWSFTMRLRKYKLPLFFFCIQLQGEGKKKIHWFNVFFFLMLGLERVKKTLAILNIDLEPNLVDPQLRAALQWLAASETEVSGLYFHDTAAREFVLVSSWVWWMLGEGRVWWDLWGLLYFVCYISRFYFSTH